MDVKVRQRAVIEFLLLEGCTDEETAIRLRNVYSSDASCYGSIFRRINDVRSGNKELCNEGRPRRPYGCEKGVAIPSILQDEPNASLRTIAETLSISPETFRTHMSRVGYTLKSWC
jgi:hypothetical protein